MHRDPGVAAAHNEAHLGQSLERVEDDALLTGRGGYGDDTGSPAGTLHAAVLRSPHAHAEVVSVDTSAALAMRGVRAVLTGDDVKRWSQPFVVGVKQPMQHWALAVDRVRYVGEPVAVVVAEDRYLAEDALDAVRVEFRPLPVVIEIERACDPDAPLLHDEVGSNVVSDRHFCYGDPQAAFAGAARCVALTINYPRNTCTPIECGVVVAEHLAGDRGYDVLSNFMGPFSLHAVMALALKVGSNKLRHRLPRDSGGSFGVKQAVFPYVVLMCLASRKAGAPVKWVEDRLEHLAAATSSPGRLTTVEAALDGDGRILALRYDQTDEVGGYLRAPEPASLYRMHGALTGAYDIAHVEVRNRIVVTNKTPSGLVRGFGGPQLYFTLERLMDRIAVELGIDAFELRRRNFVKADQFPYHAAAGAVYDSGDYARTLDLALKAADMPGLAARRDAARAAGKLYGIGCSAVVEPSVSNMGYISAELTAEQRAKAGPKNGGIAAATVSIDLLGGVNIGIASAPAGQGHMTVCAQVAADVFGLRPEQIAVNVEFDTAKDAWSVAAGNYSSRFAGAVAGTVHLAAVKLRDKMARMAAAQLDCPLDQIVFADGKVFDRDRPEHGRSFGRVAGAAHWAPATMPQGMEPGLRETVFWSPETLTAPDSLDRVNTSAAYSFAFDICGVEVDPDSGRVRVDRYVTAHDAGRLLNPALANGQIRGAFTQGLGAALFEELRYAADGSFQSGTLADYLIPTACEVPNPVIVHMESPSPFTPLGAKGLGEGNNMSTPVCIANAYADALRPLHDVSDVRLPLTPSRVLLQIGAAEPEPPPALRHAQKSSAPAGSGLALHAAGSVDIAVSPERVFAVLLDPIELAKVIPGCHELVELESNSYRADVSVGVGLVKARYEARISLSEIDRPHSLRLDGQGSSPLGIAAGTGSVRLEATASGSRLHYDYSARVGGKVAAVGSRLLEGAARVVLAQLFESLGRQATGAVSLTWWQRLLRRIGISA